MPSIAFFITPHGFGHATRASALMQAIQAIRPNMHFDVFSMAPTWLFHESLTEAINHHRGSYDVGLVQSDPLHENLPETLQRLEALVPFRGSLVAQLACQVKEAGCALVVCDIAPVGIAVARAAGIPSVLVENFTWDWIYSGYLPAEPRLAPYIDYLEKIFKQASYHIQTEPLCQPDSEADLQVGPMSRPPDGRAADIRHVLGIPDGKRLVVIGISGSENSPDLFASLPAFSDFYYIFMGQQSNFKIGDDRMILPAGFYYPNLLQNATALVGKTGYSSVAEAAGAGIPFVYIDRPTFRESAVISRFIRRSVGGFEIGAAELAAGDWLPRLEVLLQKHTPSPQPNSAAAAADFIVSRMAS